MLGAVAATLQSLATTTAANQLASDQRLTRIEAVTEQNSAAIGRLEVQVASNSASVDRMVKSLEDSCNDLASMIGRSVEQGDRDQAEIRRILDYLFGQQRNGNGSG